MPWVADDEPPKKGWVVDNDPRSTAGYQTAKAKAAEVYQAPKFLPQPVQGYLNRQRDKALSVMQGTGMDWADEAAGKVAQVVTGGLNAVGVKTPYTAGEAGAAFRDNFNETRNAYAEQHPVENATYALMGGSATGRLGGGAIQGARTLGGAVAASAAVGGAYGAVTGAGSGEGLKDRAQKAAFGGGAGAVVGAAAPLVARGAQEVVARLPGRMGDETAALQQADEALQTVGINIRSLSTTAQARLRGAIRTGRDPREAALAIVATTDLPVPVPMTRGDRSGEPGQQLSENLMLRGQKGTAAARHMRGVRGEQQDALRGNVDAIGGAVAGGQLPARGQGAQVAAERLGAMRQEAEGGVNAAYTAAREVGGDAMLPSGQGPRQAMLESLTGSYDLRNIERVAREVESFGQDGAPTVRQLFDARTRLSNLTQSSDNVEGGAARTAVRALDQHIDQALTEDMFLGDKTAVDAWRQAIGARRDFGRLFESGDLIEKLTEPAMRGGSVTMKVDPGDAANYILGRSDLGFVGRQNLHRDLSRLRGVLGPDSPEWNGIRGEVFGRLASAAEGGVEAGQRQFSGVKFSKAWSDLNRRDPNLANTLFTADERAQIDRFAGIAARVTSSVRGGDNPSNTAVAAARMLGNLRFLKGVPFVKGLTDEIEVQVNLGAARAATAPTPARVQRPRPTGNPFVPTARTAP